MDEPSERRARRRTRILRNAKIIAPRSTSMIHCTVQDITSAGAGLKVANTYGMPQAFELTFEQGRTRRSCRVVWCTNDSLGVMFEDPAAVSYNSATAAMRRSMSSGRDSR